MLNPSEKTCLSACQACATACLQCAIGCLQESEVKMLTGCIRLDLECAHLCSLAASSLARTDAHRADTCRLCAQVCQDCAAECVKHDMAHCQACADACRQCAGACLAMVQ
jgi:hypothetical protein